MPEAEKKTLSQDFAEFVKAKRMAKGMSLAQLAEKIYADPSRASYLSKIENGKREVSANTMGFILEALDSWIEFIE